MARTDTTNGMVDAVLDISAPVLGLLETGLELVPVPGLGLIPKALSAVVDQVKGARANKDACDSFRAQVELLSSVIGAIASKAKDIADTNGMDAKRKERVVDEIAQSTDLQKGIEELRSTIQGLQEDARRLDHGKGIPGFLKSVVHKSRDEGVISGMKARLVVAIQAFQIRGHLVIDQGVQEMRRVLREADDAAKIKDIPRVSASFDAPGVAHLKGEFLEGTRTALFAKEIEPWLTGSYPEDSPRPIFFLNGGAGLGKSSITHHLCTRLHDPQRHGRLGASYFFIRSDGTLASPAVFFSTLLHQLALSRASLRPSIVTAVRRYLERGDAQNMEAVSNDILRTALLSEPEDARDLLFLVFDGLDECRDRKKLPQLLLALLALVRDIPWLRVFMASRPEPHIMAVLTSPDTGNLVHHRTLESTSSDSRKDVEFYLRDSVSKIPEYAACLPQGSDDMTRLVARAGTSFVFASIAVRFLDTYRDDPRGPLALLLQSRRGEGLEELDALYLQVLHSAYPPREMRLFPDRHARVLSLFYVVALPTMFDWKKAHPAFVAGLGTKLMNTELMKSRLYATEPGRTAAIVISEEDICHVVDRLRSILFIGDDGAILPLHATFFEFIFDERRCSDPLYHVNKAQGHASLMAAWLDSGSTSVEAVTTFLTRTSADPALWHWPAPVAWLYHCFHGAEFHSHDRWQEILQTLSIHIPIVMRLYNDSENIWTPDQPQWASPPWIVKRSYTEFTTPTTVELEFLKFSLYSLLWWSIGLEAEFKDREIKPEHIARLINYHFHSDVTILPDDMTRYRAAHEKLAERIGQVVEDRVAEGSWYNHTWWYRSSSPLWDALDAWDEGVPLDVIQHSQELVPARLIVVGRQHIRPVL